MSHIQLSQLTFAHEGSFHNIFDHVDLRLDSRWKIGLIGRNGTGKTTLLHLLEGRYPYQGNISAEVNFQYFPPVIPNPEQSCADVARALCHDYEDWRLERELARLGVDPDRLERSFFTLSGGERSKVLLAILFLNDNGFPLIDEPTNHLDSHGRKLVAQYLRSKSGFILVSHDRAFLDACVDHVLSIQPEGIELQRGNYSSWRANRDAWEKHEAARRENLEREVKHLEAASERTARWSQKTEQGKYGAGPVDRGFIGHKAAKMMKRSKTLEQRRENALEEKSALLVGAEKAERLKIWPLKHHATVLAEGNELVLFHDPKNSICPPLHFTLSQGDRLALIGKNGSGKSSLLKLITGEDIGHIGFFRRASGLTVSYVPQDVSWLAGTLEAFAHEYHLDENLFRAILSRLDMPGSLWRDEMRGFSDGQKKKVMLARSLSEKAHLYIWDEPLNFMDMPSREQIEELVVDFEPTLLFVEHDQAFMDRVATAKLEW